MCVYEDLAGKKECISYIFMIVAFHSIQPGCDGGGDGRHGYDYALLALV
jgi:hypothetical protein